MQDLALDSFLGFFFVLIVGTGLEEFLIVLDGDLGSATDAARLNLFAAMTAVPVWRNEAFPPPPGLLQQSTFGPDAKDTAVGPLDAAEARCGLMAGTLLKREVVPSTFFPFDYT